MSKQINSQQLVGLIILIVGFGFLLEMFTGISFGSYLSTWWPLLIVILGLLGLATQNRSGSLIMLVIGGLLLLSTLGYVTVNVWSLFWPLVLVAFGISLLTRRARPAGATLLDHVDAFALFGGAERRVSSERFTGGNITAFFGGIKLDLRKATLAPDATIDVFTAFGGGEIIVPEDCHVVISALPIFGAWEDKTEHAKEQKQILTIRGTSLFGGVSVKN